MTPRGWEGFSELYHFCLFLAINFKCFSFFEVNSFMSILRRSQARKNEMTSDSADYSRKLDDILAKMDVLITAKTKMLSKVNKLEKAQSYDYEGRRRPEEECSRDRAGNSRV